MKWLPAPLHRAGLRVVFPALQVCRWVLRYRRRAVCVLVRCPDGVLVVRHSYRKGLGLPAGSPGWGEPAVDSAARELEEEVGIRVAPGDLEQLAVLRIEELGSAVDLIFYQVEFDDPPVVRIDNREIIWADFYPEEGLLDLDLTIGTRCWFERQAASDVPSGVDVGPRTSPVQPGSAISQSERPLDQ